MTESAPSPLPPALPPLDRYRSYLHVLARAQLHPGIGRRLDASDIVQQTLLEAHRDQDGFQGGNPAQLAGWLRRILAHNLANALRDLGRAKRDAERELGLDAALDSTGRSLRSWLAADAATPSEIVSRHEHLLQLAEAMERLPADQCQALALRYWQALPLAEIAERMERTPASVAGLLHRGLTQLRGTLATLEA